MSDQDMIPLTIGDRTIQVDKKFRDLPRAEQEAFVSSFIKQHGMVAPSKEAEQAAPKGSPNVIPSYDTMGNYTGMSEVAPEPSQMPYGEQMSNAAGAILKGSDKFMRGVAKGASLGMADRVAALARSKMEGIPYDQALKEEVSRTNSDIKSMGPMGSVSELAGMALPVTGAAKLGLSPLLAFGPRVGAMGRVGLSAGEGALWGAAQGAGENYGPNWQDKVAAAGKGAATGAVGGALIGGGIEGLAGAGRWLGNKVGQYVQGQTNPMANLPASARRLLENVGAWEGIPKMMERRAELGPEATLLDLGPSMRSVGQGVAARPGSGANDLRQVLEAREAGRTGRLASDTEASFGKMAGDEGQLTADLLAQRSAVHKELSPIFENAPPIDPTPVLQVIRSRLANAKGPEKAALEYAESLLVAPNRGVPTRVPSSAPTAPGATPRSDLLQTAPAPGLSGPAANPPSRPGPVLPAQETPAWLQQVTNPDRAGLPVGVETNAAALNNAKEALSGLVDFGNQAMGIEKGSLSKAEGATKNVIGMINEILRRDVPGYASVMDRSSQLARKVEGVQTGFEALGGGGVNASWPRQVSEAAAASHPNVQVPGLAAPEIKAGMRARIEKEIGTNPNDLAALNKILGGEGDFNRAKLVDQFGEEAVNRVLKAIERERSFQQTFNDIYRGSQTAPRKFGAEAVQEATGPVNVPRDLTLTGLVAGGAQSLIRGMTGLRGTEARDALARTLGVKGPELDAILARLAKEQELRGAMSNTERYAVPGLLGGQQ